MSDKALRFSLRGAFRWCAHGGFLLLFAAAIGACTEEAATPVASPPLMESGADAVLTGLTHNITVNGVRQGHLVADTAFSFTDSATYRLVSPNLIMYTETGVEKARVTSERGRYNPTTKEMLATGNVILVITEGSRRVESEELNYSPNGDRIWSDSFTVMREPGRILEGMGFDSDLSFETVVVGPGSIRNTGEAPAAQPEADTLAPTPAETLALPDTAAVPDTAPPTVSDTLRALPDTMAPGVDPEDPERNPGRRPGDGGGSAL